MPRRVCQQYCQPRRARPCPPEDAPNAAWHVPVATEAEKSYQSNLRIIFANEKLLSPKRSTPMTKGRLQANPRAAMPELAISAWLLQARSDKPPRAEFVGHSSR